MGSLEFLGKQLELDADGNLKNMTDWNEDIAI